MSNLPSQFRTAAIAVAAIGLAPSVPAFAQEEPMGEPMTKSEAPVADAATDAEPAGKTMLTIDTPIEQLVADERAKAVLEKHVPGISAHPAYDQFKAMTLVQLKPWSQGMITDETLAAISADLDAPA